MNNNQLFMQYVDVATFRSIGECGISLKYSG